MILVIESGNENLRLLHKNNLTQSLLENFSQASSWCVHFEYFFTFSNLKEYQIE